jgi:hypothetical protein
MMSLAGFSAFGPTTDDTVTPLRCDPNSIVGQQLVGDGGDYVILPTGGTEQTTRGLHLIQQLVLDNLSTIARRHLTANGVANEVRRMLAPFVPGTLRELEVTARSDGGRSEIVIRAVDSDTGAEMVI